ncbi:MAG: right-handed parallel beta-helix repeat-containing protein, partial [Oscillochloris sp.]|nr:right-handed parallel beta-helix repeat-containing protein [Oscillochloris sp.]
MAYLYSSSYNSKSQSYVLSSLLDEGHPMLPRFRSALLAFVVLALITLSVFRPVQADTTAHALCVSGSAVNFTQNWSNTALITTNDSWAGVPSVEGYRGDGLTVAIDADPRTITGDGTPVLDVNANQTNPSDSATGGVSEFEITDPVVALQGSGTADAPYLIITLNSTGSSASTLAYTVRDIDGSSDNAVQQFNVQYRVGTSGAWTNVPGGYLPDASVGPSLTQDTPVAAYALPAGFNDAGTVQLRFMTTNATSSDEWLGVDDIVITPTCGTPDPCAAITFPYTLPNNAPAELITAIECANANATADVINLNGQTVTLTDSFGDFSGATGLPQVTTNITVRNGTITRSGANEFRFFSVSNTGNLTVRDMTITNGGGATYSNNGGSIGTQGLSSTLTVINTTISGSQNNDLFNGSAIYSNANFTLVNSSIVGNRGGRGTIAAGNGPVLIQNTLIAGNSGPATVNGAGGVYFGSVSSATIVNSTIVGNYTGATAATQSGGIFANTGTVNLTIHNSIIWGNRNSGNTAPQVVNVTAGTNTVTNSLIEDGIFGSLDSDPLFVTPITAS